MVQKVNPAYVLVLTYITQYIKLITFGINTNHSLVAMFPVFIKAFNRKRLTLYEIETVPVSYR